MKWWLETWAEVFMGCAAVCWLFADPHAPIAEED